MVVVAQWVMRLAVRVPAVTIIESGRKSHRERSWSARREGPKYKLLERSWSTRREGPKHIRRVGSIDTQLKATLMHRDEIIEHMGPALEAMEHRDPYMMQ
ncbi:hypothetical protein CHS0354_024812 [Potamilus streckersoni]|uniref:Uncharacterized protein n=1 Tax=Potamilus streckersoni TaxID=2493646 RepID=A0AAE0W5L0_9BIVA|nr:hypothetical protein CHS0354_024812 [Potamilus streckersoni]